MDEPFSFRFLVQPLMAFLLGLRDAKQDAAAGQPPYVLSLFTTRLTRKALLTAGLKSVALPLAVAVVLDGVVQVLVYQHVVIWKAVITGMLLIALPYMATRGLGNRLFSRGAHRRERRPA